jgi:hypothetical protein
MCGGADLAPDASESRAQAMGPRHWPSYFFPAAPNFLCNSATNSCTAFLSGDCHLITTK